MTWHLAPSLRNLFAEVDYRYPNRDKTSDGTVGDTSHSARYSDHNPDKDGWVHAVDIDSSGQVGDQVTRLLLKRARSNDIPALNYLIFERMIYSWKYSFLAHEYTGTNPHTTHVHVSIKRTDAARTWAHRWGVQRLVDLSDLKEGHRDDWKVVQRRLNFKLNLELLIDGIPGTDTENAVMKVQRLLGNNQTGYPGTDVLRWLGCYYIS